jgi:hypothetical protein
MKKKMIALLAGALMMISASSAFAAFEYGNLERFVYGASNEVATDLGNVTTLLGTSDNTIGAGASNFIAMGAGSAPLYASYFGYDGNTGNMWISAKQGLGSISLNAHGSEAGYNSATSAADMMNAYYNSKSQVTSSGAVSAVSGRNDQGSSTFFNSMDRLQDGFGTFAGMIDVNYAPTSVTLDLTKAVTQGLSFFDASTYSDTTGIVFTEVGSIRTNLDGTSTINAPVTATPIPPAFFLMGSGLLGMVGLRRRMK